MIPVWLSLVLDRLLPEKTGGERDELARAIVAAIPQSVVERAIVLAAIPALADRGITDGAGDLARSIGRRAAESVAIELLEAP